MRGTNPPKLQAALILLEFPRGFPTFSQTYRAWLCGDAVASTRPLDLHLRHGATLNFCYIQVRYYGAQYPDKESMRTHGCVSEALRRSVAVGASEADNGALPDPPHTALGPQKLAKRPVLVVVCLLVFRSGVWTMLGTGA